MAKIEIDQPKTLVVSQKLLWVIVVIIMAQVGLFAFGFYRNLKPSVKYVEKTIILPSEDQGTVIPPPSTPLPKPPQIRPFPDLAPLPKGFQDTSRRILIRNQFQFDPAVNNPLEDRLLRDARTARVKSDMRMVALKLGEVLTKFPESVHAHYQLADMYEAMGIYDKAIEHYEAVFSFGLSVAGPLYKTASQKLIQGFYKETNYGEKMAIGTIHQFEDSNITQAQDITITIPIISSPSHVIEPDQVSIEVKIFDKQGKNVVRSLHSNSPEFTWSRPVRDWMTNGEEFLIAKYYLTNDETNPLFQSLEPRAYYGYVIELYYEGVLLDQVAWPRILSNKIAGQSGSDLFDFSFEDGYDDINPENLLLPLPENKPENK